MILVSPRHGNKGEEKQYNVQMTPSVNKKEPNHFLPPTSNKNLPPRPNHPSSNLNNNVSYKMPPRPTPLIPSKQNNSVDYSRSHSK